MPKQITAFIIATLATGAGIYLYSRHFTAPSDYPAPLQVKSSAAQDGKNLLLAMKGVKKFCVDAFEMKSCMVYFSRCQESCLTILPVPARVRMLTAYNGYLAKHGQKTYQYRVPSQARESIIGR